MRVLMLSGRFYPLGNGTEHQALALSLALAERGLDVSVVTARFRGLTPASTVHGIRVDRLPYAPDRRPLRRLAKYTFMVALTSYLFRRLRAIDILHCHMAEFTIIPAVLASRRFGRPVIVKIASPAELALGSAGELGPLVARMLAQAAAVVAPSRQIERQLAEQGYRSGVYIPNGVDIHRFHPPEPAQRLAARARLGISPDTLLVGSMGRLAVEKALDLLVHAWMVSKLPKLGGRLCLAGTGPQEGTLRSLVAAAGDLAQSVQFVGQVDPVEYLHALDVFVLPSRYEGLPNALLEAMACGVACVVSQIGGTQDLIEHGLSGLMVPVAQVSSLAAALEELTSASLREGLGNAAKSRARRTFSLEAVASQYHELYERL
jgi:glycosyltransferase involved in cell wall biosynthesis